MSNPDTPLNRPVLIQSPLERSIHRVDYQSSPFDLANWPERNLRVHIGHLPGAYVTYVEDSFQMFVLECSFIEKWRNVCDINLYVYFTHWKKSAIPSYLFVYLKKLDATEILILGWPV